jgi:hypothetical protein
MERLQERVLAGMQFDAGKAAPGAHAVGVSGLGKAMGHGAAMVEPHGLSV